MKKIFILFFMYLTLIAYDQPDTLNFGYTNILEGGPIHPSSGWYIQPYIAEYYTKTFTNPAGGLLGGVPSPTFNIAWGIIEVIYQAKKSYFWNARLGIDIELFFDLYSKVSKNNLGITSNGAGFSDPYIGIYLQWDPVIWHDRPLFVHRFEFAASFPAGKYNKNFFFNPGNGFYYINPNWSATFYFTRHWAASCNLNYVWSAKNKKTGVQAGQAILINYSMEAEFIRHLWLAVNGYYLNQYTDTKVDGFSVPGRRDRIFSIGPGMLYRPDPDFNLFAYLYFESKSRNFTQGISTIISLVKHF